MFLEGTEPCIRFILTVVYVCIDGSMRAYLEITWKQSVYGQLRLNN